MASALLFSSTQMVSDGSLMVDCGTLTLGNGT
jgi:hypothetical protein